MTPMRHLLARLRLRPRDFQPLPLLGIPGAVAENADSAYYDDMRQFRPQKRGPAKAGPAMEAEI